MSPSRFPKKTLLGRKKRKASFILLEVIVAMLILAVGMTAILRGFMMALSTIRENRVIEQAALLAETLMDDYEVEPPLDGKKDGAFEDDDRFGDDYAFFYWERDVDEEKLKYNDRPRNPLQELEPVYDMELKIIYDDGNYRRFEAIVIHTRLSDIQLFSDDAIQANQLF